MYAQLMRAARERLERKPCDANDLGLARCRIAGRPSHHLPCGDGRLPRGIVLHPPAARRVLAAEGKFDAALLLCRPAGDHRPISFTDLPVLEQPAERGQRLAVAAKHKTAGRIAIESMRAWWRPRQPETLGAALALDARAGRRASLHRQARGLAAYQQ